MSTQLKRAIALSAPKVHFTRDKVSPMRQRLNGVIQLIHDFKGHDIHESNITKTKNRFVAKQMEDRLYSQMSLDTASMIQEQATYNPKIVKWLFEETIIAKNTDFKE